MYGKKQKAYPLIPTITEKSNKGRSFALERFLEKYPLSFRRQYVIGNYIVDFYCHKAHLVIELDGSGHYEPEQIEKDYIRTQYLESLGLKILRFTNLEVKKCFFAVCERIDETAKAGEDR